MWTKAAACHKKNWTKQKQAATELTACNLQSRSHSSNNYKEKTQRPWNRLLSLPTGPEQNWLFGFCKLLKPKIYSCSVSFCKTSWSHYDITGCHAVLYSSLHALLHDLLLDMASFCMAPTMNAKFLLTFTSAKTCEHEHKTLETVYILQACRDRIRSQTWLRKPSAKAMPCLMGMMEIPLFFQRFCSLNCSMAPRRAL